MKNKTDAVIAWVITICLGVAIAALALTSIDIQERNTHAIAASK